MYEVFAVEDSVTTFCFEKKSRIRWPYEGPADPGMIVVRTTEAMTGHPLACAKVRHANSCMVYRWRASDLQFHPDKAAAVRRCGA